MLRTIEKVVAQVKSTFENVEDLWYKVRVVLTRALEPYPEARAAVARAVEEEFCSG